MASKSGITILEPLQHSQQLSEVEQWLVDIRLDTYTRYFEEAGIHFMADLMEMDKEQTRTLIFSAVMKVAEAKRLRRELRVLQLSTHLQPMLVLTVGKASSGGGGKSEPDADSEHPATSGKPDDVIVVENAVDGTAFNHCVWICPFFDGSANEDSIEAEVQRIADKLTSENSNSRIKC